MDLDLWTKLLQTYNGRDKIVRTTCYVARFASGFVSSPENARKLQKFGSQLSACRAILRLFDDLPMLNVTISYGLGRHEKDKLIRALDVITNFIDQVYFPVEHMSWAIDNGYISSQHNHWELSCTLLWIASLYLSIMRAIRSATILQSHRLCLRAVDRDVSGEMSKLTSQQWNEVLTAIRFGVDLVQAVSMLPEGYMWGGKLNVWQIGAVGTVSSLIGLYQAIRKVKSQK